MSLLDDFNRRLSDRAKSDTPPDNTQPQKSLLQKVMDAKVPYVLNESVFSDWAVFHRPHQLYAISEIDAGHPRGQVVIPTGTGKTRVQIHIHIEDMIKTLKCGNNGVYVIGAHRLLLCKQLMDELQDLCLRIGIPINALYIGSAVHDEKDVYEKYYKHGVGRDTYRSAYTTSGSQVKKFYDKTKEEHRNLIVVTTYHSFDKLKHIDSINICTYDEAHVTTEIRFFNNIASVVPRIKRNYFFTATRKISGEDGGMNFKDLYGEILSAIPPTTMIEVGEIVKPKIHTIYLEDGRTGEVSKRDELMLIKTVQEAYLEHRKYLKNDSAYPDLIGAKLLVSARGSYEIGLIQKNMDFRAWCSDNKIKVFSFSSEHGSYEDFVRASNRNNVYESMRSMEDTVDAILFHIDILTEGVDLPSITGILLLRHLNNIKLFQSLGRALRLLKKDRERLYAKKLLPQNRDQFIKPYAYLILPTHFQEMDESSEEMKASLIEVIEHYGIPTEEFLLPEEYDCLSNEYLDPVTQRELIEKRNKTYPLAHAITELVINKFKCSLPSDTTERYNLLMNLFDKLGENKNA